MKIAIIGAGGVGGYFGAKIAQAGYAVSFVARGEHLQAIKARGLTVKSIGGDFHCIPAQATDRIADIGEADVIILGVKAWQIKSIVDELKTVVTEKTSIVPLQNGILAIEELKEKIPRQNILGGLCLIAACIEEAGVVNHSGIPPTIIFGEMSGVKTPRAQQIKDIFDTSGIQSRVSVDIHADVWRKFIAICVSGLSALTKSTYGELRALKETRDMIMAILTEGYRLSQKMGIALESDCVDTAMKLIDFYPFETTPSLARDIWEGKPSELEYQNGTIVKLGKRYEVDTPINDFIYRCILPMEMKARKRPE